MSRVLILSSFERSIKRFTQEERALLAEALEAFNLYILTGKASFGFRFKKINGDKYEFRLNARLRVVVKKDSHAFYLVVAGNHDDIRKYLCNYRNT